MRTRFLIVQLLCFVLGADLCRAATNEAVGPKVTLKALVTIEGHTTAYLESEVRAPSSSSVILREGERMGDIEVTQIDLPQRRVSARIRGEVRELTFGSEAQAATPILPSSGNPPDGNNVALCLDKMGLEQILRLYVELANRTVLRPAPLPAFEFSFCTRENISAADLMSAITSALKEKGVIIQVHGDKFLIVAREPDVSLITPEVKSASDALASSLAQASESKADELLPAGLINFQNTDLFQVVQI